ncbi:MAG: formate dehydrogenase accessory protein FdhE [Deltaproteobacteria bacterium]|nr:formate dehydrogenase accessory protein FdhE [Deltaproteobacteria bacterium]
MDEDYLKHIDRLIRQRPSAAPALQSFRELARLMIQAAPTLDAKIPEQSHLEIRREEGFPLFSRDDLPVDFGAAAALFNQSFKYLSETDREDRTGLQKALKQSEKDPQWTEGLFKAILKQDEKALAAMAGQVGLDHPVLLFLGKTALRPSLLALRHLMGESLHEKEWGHGHCPLCGSQPDMAYFTKRGKRRLHCELCGEEWAFARIGCPFCNNEKQEDLGYFEAEGEEGLRVYFCRSCRRYIKTIDGRVFEEIAPLELESLATLHLDVIAHENGFK